MPTTESPLRYPGGKTQLAPFVADLLAENNLIGGVYAEPYCGGAGLALRLLFRGQVGELWLNDLDEAVHALWHTVLNRPDELCRRIEQTPVTMEEWHRQRRFLADPRSSSIRRGFAALFLNRTNRSGILTGGVIGGKDQVGAYLLDCRFNKPELISKIQRIAAYRDAITLTRLDGVECLRLWAKRLPRRGLVNIDPPYFSQGRDLYLSFYEPADHAALATFVRQLHVSWMVTYDDVPEIRKLYSGLPTYRSSLAYYAQVKRRATELTVLSPGLKLPQTGALAAA